MNVVESPVIESNLKDYTSDSCIDHELHDPTFVNSNEISYAVDLRGSQSATEAYGDAKSEIDRNNTNSKIENRKPVRKRNLTLKKNLPTDGWRLVDAEFDKLHALFNFTLEACCDPLGLNGHHNLPYCSQNDSFLLKDVSKESVFCNPPWSLAA